MVTLLEIKRDGSHFTAQRGLRTSVKRLAARSLRVIVTLPERLVKSFYPTIPTSHAERAAATGQRSPAGPRRLGAATRISALLFRRLSVSKKSFLPAEQVFNGAGHPSWASRAHPSFPLRRIYHFIDSLRLREHPRPRPKSGKVRRSDTRPGDVCERAERSEGSDSTPIRNAPCFGV